MVSVVFNVGGLGIIIVFIFLEFEGFCQEIWKCWKLISKLFGVNIIFLFVFVFLNYEVYVQVIIDEGVKIVEIVGNFFGFVIFKFKKVGCIVFYKCIMIRYVQFVVKFGVDFLSIDGFECVGYVFR